MVLYFDQNYFTVRQSILIGLGFLGPARRVQTDGQTDTTKYIISLLRNR